MKSKKGSHVGMILSFAIFITFIVFLYAILNPAINTGEDKKTTLDYVERQILGNVSANFTSVSITINEADNPSQDCVEFETLLILAGLNWRLIIKNETGGIQSSLLQEERYNLLIDRVDNDNRFFKIYSSEEFPLLETGEFSPCKAIQDDEYTINVLKNSREIYESEIYRLAAEYETDYEGVKARLDIPPESEFEFIFLQSNGSVITALQENKPSNVYAGEIPVEYVDSSANIESGFINVRIW